MNALIFAAGLGTRLGRLGKTTPKALIEVGGVTMLERTVRRVVAAGADRVVVNVSHHAERIERFVAEHELGVEVLLSREPDGPLETGGGLWHARDLFRRDRPILLHNVDVITDADLAAIAAAQERSSALATLAVNDRASSRFVMASIQASNTVSRGASNRRSTRKACVAWVISWLLGIVSGSVPIDRTAPPKARGNG